MNWRMTMLPSTLINRRDSQQHSLAGRTRRPIPAILIRCFCAAHVMGGPPDYKWFNAMQDHLIAQPPIASCQSLSIERNENWPGSQVYPVTFGTRDSSGACQLLKSQKRLASALQASIFGDRSGSAEGCKSVRAL